MDTGIVARELLAALDEGQLLPSVAEYDPAFDWDAAYSVAAEIVALRRARGETPVGRKIGFTNRNIWAEYGATSPIWAHVYDRTLTYARDAAATLSLRGSAQPRLEPEIAFRLKAPVAPGCREPEEVLQAIEWYAPSFEIVCCHFPHWKFKPVDSAADFSFHWRLVVGTPVAVRQDDITALAAQLRDCKVALSREQLVLTRGVGANALNHPALALTFLADILARQPQFEALAPGEIITTGTLTTAMPIKAGETWSSTYAGLSGVTGLALKFTD
ncbi:MAG: fumarylacetoacetate hydrolase family protein [Betaproteobacteria bacterium]|nr:fumarylacetoacetate hydrolase family protein [Betaproteobacteria bacterium]